MINIIININHNINMSQKVWEQRSLRLLEVFCGSFALMVTSLISGIATNIPEYSLTRRVSRGSFIISWISLWSTSISLFGSFYSDHRASLPYRKEDL